jgi:hypothetical protein
LGRRAPEATRSPKCERGFDEGRGNGSPDVRRSAASAGGALCEERRFQGGS